MVMTRYVSFLASKDGLKKAGGPFSNKIPAQPPPTANMVMTCSFSSTAWHSFLPSFLPTLLPSVSIFEAERSCRSAAGCLLIFHSSFLPTFLPFLSNFTGGTFRKKQLICKKMVDPDFFDAHPGQGSSV